MIRSLVSVVALPLAVLCVGACQPSGEGARTAGEASLPSGDAMPATYDWRFLAHGGSGELNFGDGDWAEGVSVFTLSCLPRSRSVEASWGYDEEAVLTAGTATGTFQPGVSIPTDHPVIAALRSTGALSVGLSQADMRLVGKADGKAELAAFFDYCDQGREPEAPAPTPQDQAEANAAEIAAQAGETPPASAPDAAPAT